MKPLAAKRSLTIVSFSLAALFTQQGYAETIKLAELAAEAGSEQEIDQLFEEGMRLREAGDYEASIAAFKGVLSSEPTLGRVRAELAVSYLRALNFAAAKEEAEALLADPETPETVKFNIEYFLNEVEKKSKTHVFTPYISFGLGHDDNINAGPSTTTINLGGGQIGELASSAQPSSRNFNMVNVGFGHRYLSPNPVTVFDRSAAYIWQSNVSYYRNDYFDNGDFDLDVLSLSTGPLAVVADRWRMGVDVTYDYIRLGHEKLADIYGVSPSITWNMSKNTDISLVTKFQKRDFDESVAAGRDSDYQSVDLNIGRGFYDAKLTLQVGAGLFNESADVDRFGNDGYQVSAGANWKAAANDNLYFNTVYSKSKFDGDEVLFNESRDERENRYSLGFNHRFTEKYVRDWTMDASISHIDNDSNIPIYSYRRTKFSLTFSKYF